MAIQQTEFSQACRDTPEHGVFLLPCAFTGEYGTAEEVAQDAFPRTAPRADRKQREARKAKTTSASGCGRVTVHRADRRHSPPLCFAPEAAADEWLEEQHVEPNPEAVSAAVRRSARRASAHSAGADEGSRCASVSGRHASG